MSAQQQQINYGNTANDGQGDPLRTAFIKTDDNFDAIWNTGPVGSNVTILNNTVQVVAANGNLVLAANGIGVIQTNTSVVPRFANLYDLGSANLRYRSAYIGSGGLNVSGNLTVGGSYSISNLTVNSISSDDSSFVTIQDGLSVRGDIDTVGIYTDGYFFANGAPFSPGSAYGNADVANYLPVYGGEILSSVLTVGNIDADEIDVANIRHQFPIFIQSNGGGAWEFAGNILYGPEGGSWQSAANTIYLSSPANGYITLQSFFNSNIVSELFMEHSFIRFLVDNGGPPQTWQMNLDGSFDMPNYTFPGADGAAGQILKTYGNGVLYWTTDSSDYGNANVVALGESGWSGNIIPSANVTYSLGNATNYWSNLWVANNTIYIGGVPLGVSGNTLTVNGEAVLSNDSDSSITTTGNLAAGNILTDNYLYANGEPFVSSSTGNITFTNTTMSPPDGEDLFITAANSEVEITGEDFRVEVTDDVRIQGNNIVSIRNISNVDSITIRTDYNGNDYSWEFDATGNLITPGNIEVSGDITVAGQITGTSSASTLVLAAEPNSNTAIQLNNTVDSIIRTVANLEIRTDSSNTDQTWIFETTGNLIAAGNINSPGTVVAASFETPGFIEAVGNITGGNLIATGNVVGNVSGFAIGYRDIPQVSFTGNATIATTDAGKHFYSTESTDYILTIANNASQGFQVGAAITIVNQGTGNITIAQGSGVTLYLAGNASSGNRNVTTFGMATIMKVATDTWFINGTGVV